MHLDSAKKQQCLQFSRNVLSSWTAISLCVEEKAMKPSEATELRGKHHNKQFP